MRSAHALVLFLLQSYLFTHGSCYSLDGKCESGTPVRSRTGASNNRRRDIISSISVVSSLLPWYSSPPCVRDAYAEEILSELSTTQRTAQYIERFCNPNFLSSVVKSKYNFLYRGLSPSESEDVARNDVAAIIIADEPFDLLDPDTYGSSEAASYFQNLEKDMTARELPIRPSNGHVATTCPKEAARWGTAASIWPLGGKGVDFAWLQDGGVFWPIDEDNPEMKRRVITTCISDGCKKDDLSNVLQRDACDVMFRADNGFLAVPADLDGELRTCLMGMN